MDGVWVSAAAFNTAALAVAGLATSISVIYISTIRPMRRGWRQMAQIHADWSGTEARPGFKAHPGMPERMAGMESEIAEIRRELTANGGSSLRDAVRRIEQQQKATAYYQGSPVIANTNGSHSIVDGHE